MEETKETAIDSGHVTDYERAICYYTLPRVTSPMSFGLIVAYGVCFVEAAGALIYGLASGHEIWTRWGMICMGAIVAFGIVTFLGRAFLNEVRERRALAAAQGVPDAAEDLEDTPDPFSNHVLLRHIEHYTGHDFAVTDNRGETQYNVSITHHGRVWNVKDGEDEPLLELRVWKSGRSFLFSSATPRRFTVSRDGEEVAHGQQRFSLRASIVDVQCNGAESLDFTVKDRGIYRGERLVGRIYYLRRHVYLDVEEDSFHHGILGFFITMA